MKTYFALFNFVVLVACSSSNTPDQITTNYQDKLQSYKAKTVANVQKYSNSRHGEWRYINSVTKTTAEVESYAYTESLSGKNRYGKKLVLGVSCSEKEWGSPYHVYVRTDQVTNGLRAYRFNDSEANAYITGDVWSGMDGVTLNSSNSREFINQALKKEYVFIEMSMYSESNIEPKFSLAGFSKAFEKVHRDCSIARN